MATLYAFDEHKNKVAFDANIPKPVAVPMQLPDGSILFYDRGEQYGEYFLVNNEVVRQSEGVDDGTDDSQNWRYLICDSVNLSERKEWGLYDSNEGLTEEIAVGYGLPNTEAMLLKYGSNSSYIWQLVQNKRNTTDGKKWFVPSKDELSIVYQNKDIITQNGGDFPTDFMYWSSSEYYSNRAWSQNFSDGTQYSYAKSNKYLCRLLRRI